MKLRRKSRAFREEHSAVRAELAGLEERRRAEQAARQRLENQIPGGRAPAAAAHAGDGAAWG